MSKMGNVTRLVTVSMLVLVPGCADPWLDVQPPKRVVVAERENSIFGIQHFNVDANANANFISNYSCIAGQPCSQANSAARRHRLTCTDLESCERLCEKTNPDRKPFCDAAQCFRVKSRKFWAGFLTALVTVGTASLTGGAAAEKDTTSGWLALVSGLTAAGLGYWYSDTRSDWSAGQCDTRINPGAIDDESIGVFDSGTPSKDTTPPSPIYRPIIVPSATAPPPAITPPAMTETAPAPPPPTKTEPLPPPPSPPPTKDDTSVKQPTESSTKPVDPSP